MNSYSGAPFYYNYTNMTTANHDPSTMHVQGTGLNYFFAKYLLQKVFSVFKWTLPDGWARDYFLYVLYCWGFISIVQTDKFGVIPQGCGLQGFDVFYRPTKAVIANPLISGILTPKIGSQCTIIKLQPDYSGIMDIVEYYANILALCASTAGVNILNSKLSFVYRASNKAQAESFKKMFDNIASGEPAVFIDKLMANEEDGAKNWEPFQQNLKENYIAGDILSDMKKWIMEFDSLIGIPNANTDKKERLITPEVASNNNDTYALSKLWLESLKKGCEEANAMFNINMNVEFRDPPEASAEAPEGGEDDASRLALN